MSENGPRTGAARDVPPPRPIPAAPATDAGEDDGPLARAARAVADAVAGLVGGAGGRATGAADDPGTGRRSVATGLGDVVGAVVGALGAAWGRREGEDAATGGPATPPGSPAGDRTPVTLLGDLLAAAAPRLPIRDRAALRRAYPGASDAEIADALVSRAARLTSAVGMAAGGLSAAHWFATPSLLTVPLELGAETVLIAGVEVVLLGELHELHGRPAAGDARGRASAYLSSWSAQRGVEAGTVAGLGSLLGVAGMRALRHRMGRRMVRSTASAAPFLLGAALGSRANRRATEELAGRVLADLDPRRPAGDR